MPSTGLGGGEGFIGLLREDAKNADGAPPLRVLRAAPPPHAAVRTAHNSRRLRNPQLPPNATHTHNAHTQLPYLLPLLDTLPYGRFIFLQFPYVARALAPLGPVNALYHAFPFAPFVIFLVSSPAG